MPKYLVIVESPSKAKTINKYLGKNYTVMASVGHLRDLPKSKLGVDIEHDFRPEYITIRGKGELISKLKKAAKSADKIYLATDPDREGEAISWHIAGILGIDAEKEPCRLTFNAVTKSAVTSSFKSARTIDKNLVDAQQARRVLDRIVGYKISPLLWEKVRRGLSAGRVQSVTTKLVVDREREISAFVPKEYWTIAVRMTDEKGRHPFEARYYGINGKKKELTCRADVDEVLKKLDGADIAVENVAYGKKSRHPAPPFTTSTLIQDASRKLNFASKRTMATAQALYEGVDVPGRGTLGLITYMRTDSLRIAPEAQAEARSLIANKFGEKYVPEKPNFYKTGKNAQDAHEAIRPSVVDIEPESIKGKVTNDQYRLYKLIWERFIASQMSNAEYDAMSADIKANDVSLKASSTAVSFMGYSAVYAEESDEEEEKKSKKLISLETGQKLLAEEITPDQHFTEPPARYTEGSLAKAMEENGIGRPSTYAQTISTIVGRGYVAKEKKLLRPTELGFIVTDLMAENFRDLVDVEFTANMEKRLDEIEDGNEDWVKVVSDFYGPFETELEKAKTNIEKVVIKDEESDEICEKC
ncbi:MAG: type I DNA topoisomerase, partial [Clostridia bacterium]